MLCKNNVGLPNVRVPHKFTTQFSTMPLTVNVTSFLYTTYSSESEWLTWARTNINIVWWLRKNWAKLAGIANIFEYWKWSYNGILRSSGMGTHISRKNLIARLFRNKYIYLRLIWSHTGDYDRLRREPGNGEIDWTGKGYGRGTVASEVYGIAFYYRMSSPQHW